MARVADNPDAPRKQAVRVVIDPSHPEAGDGGVVPPPEYRYPPGVSGNPSGRPKGSFDPRVPLRRKWSANPNADGEGALSVEHAERIEQAVLARDEKALECELKLLHEISGKPRETIGVTHTDGRTITTVAPDPTRPIPPLPEMPEEE